MMTNDEKAMLYDALLAAPGMGDLVKLNMTLSRKLLLLLSQVTLKTLQEKDNELFTFYPAEVQADLQTFIEECLSKNNLLDLNMKLNRIK